MNPDSRIYVASSWSFLGNAIVNGLRDNGFRRVSEDAPDGDLTKRSYVDAMFERVATEYVVLAGGVSGGIAANLARPADFMRDNLVTEINVVDAAYRFGAARLLYLASSCCYPRECPQPIKESDLGTGRLEPTNAAYATAKIAGIELCDAYRRQYGLDAITVIPSNIYGPGEALTADSAHVIGALLARFHEAQMNRASQVTVWGTGTPTRDFLYVDDFVEGSILCLSNYNGAEPINIGSGVGVTIRELADRIATVTGFKGTIEFDASKPDGMPEKVLDISKVRKLGWHPRTDLRVGLETTYHWTMAGSHGATRAMG